MILAKKVVLTLLVFFIIREGSCDGFSGRKKDKTVVESNHFYSEQKLESSIKLANVEPEKPLVLILKKKSSRQYKISENPLNILFKMANQSHTCTMSNDQSLCVIEKVTATSIEMTLKCGKTPCEASWIIYQPEINKKLEAQLGQGLFSLQESSDHLVAFISCNNPENKHFGDDVQVYSESHYERKSSGNLLYFLFVNEEKGYFYIDVKERSQQCTHISIANVPKIVEFSNKQVRDFTSKSSPSTIGLNMPRRDFRFDCYLYKQQQSRFAGPTIVKLKGIKEKEEEILSQYAIFANTSSTYIDFSITFKKPSLDFNFLSLQITGDNDKMTILNFVIDQSDSQQVDIEQKNYFSLEKGTSISYRLLPNEEAGSNSVYILFGDNSSISSSLSNCSAKLGCEFSITALQKVNSYVYLSLSEEQTVSPYIPLQKTIKRKIKQGRSLHFSKQIKAKSSFQIVINNPNVIMYASSKKKCQHPNYECNDRRGNHLHPIEYRSREDEEFIITVEGLQNGEFVITVIQEQDEYIHLQDGHSFSYIIEQEEDEILFRYTLSEKKDVSFNLVAPINHLTLEVSNAKQQNENAQKTLSTEGYVSYLKEEIDELNFIISVKKTEISLKKQTHFTLLVSSTGTVVRLEQSISHYQNMPPNSTREYIFQYDPKEEYILNFYTHNLKDQQINIMLAVAKNRVWNEQNLEQLWIDRQSDHLDLSFISKHLCQLEGEENCEIFVLLRNEMAIEVDITLTLMMRNSIIELNDGIWQSYLESTIASQAYFYFHPKHIDNDIVIIYSTIAEDLRLSYTLWKSDSKSIDPSEWPFPERAELAKQTDISSINHVSIGKETFKQQCWPDCIVLITLYRDGQTEFKVLEGYTDFKIMVSNSQIQLPEKTRINLVLKKEEEKEVLIDLKYALQKQMITIFTSYSIGSFQITANVISSANQRCPEETEAVDFQIEMGETIIQMSRIKQKIESLKMGDDENIYLCVSTKGYQNGKLSIEYSSDNNSIQLLHLNSFQQIGIDPNQSKIYKIQGFFDYSAKIIRKRGFPFIQTKTCSIKDLKACEQSFTESSERGKQILNKLDQLNPKPCSQCVNLYKFTTIEPSTFTLHINSRFSQTELKQHQLITDFVSKGEEARYAITHIRRQALSVNIHVIEGEIQATFTDNKKVSLYKSTEKGKNIIQFSTPPTEMDLTSLKESAFFGQFQFSDTFVAFHLSLKSKPGSGSATYSITYSSGENELFLHDGLVTDIVLEHETPIKFHYENEINKNHIYLTLSGSDESLLSLLDIKSYYIESEGEEEAKVEFPLTVPKMRKKTVNPTLLFSLPEQHYFEIMLTNPINKPYVISISINHQQLIMLPFDHEYPFALHPLEDISFAVQASQTGYAQVHIRKCDKSQPTFSYAFDYGDFSLGEFQNEEYLSDDSQYKTYIKLSKAGTFYLRFQAQEQASLLSVNLAYYSQKPNHGFVRAGNRGVIEHELVESKTAEVAFLPVKCQNAPCENIKYYSLASQSLQDLYAQLVCPSNYFSIEQRHNLQIIQPKQIAYDSSKPTIHFYSPLKDGKTSFIAVKAVTVTGEEVFYRPIEVVTIWGHLSRTSQSYKVSIGLIILFSICSLLCFVKYSARRGYRKLQGEPESATQMREIEM